MIARVSLADLALTGLTEEQVVRYVLDRVREGQGGWIGTPNVDICRAVRRDPAMKHLMSNASMLVPDGMPLIWASRLRGTPLPERVTGSSLIMTLSEGAALEGRSIYLLGGPPGVADLAAAVLCERYPSLTVAGIDAPPVGFDAAAAGIGAVCDRLIGARPDIVYVGLGFPKAERLIAQLTPALPAAWFLACGAAIPFAAGTLRRAPAWMQRAGLEWLFRLANEPRRLYRRYLIDDLPFALGLLATSAAASVSSPRRGTVAPIADRQTPALPVGEVAAENEPGLSASSETADEAPGTATILTHLHQGVE